MKSLITSLRYLGAVLGVLVFLGFGIGSSLVAPGHAIVLVDVDRKVYVAPPCVPIQMKNQSTLTIAQARKGRLQPDPNCRDAGGFVQEGRSLSGNLLQKFGLLPPLRSRWNPDGSWNW